MRHTSAHCRINRVTPKLISIPSIQKNPKEPTLFTNRAIARSKLGKWAEVEHDARAAIDIYGLKNPAALKSSYYLAQALLGLQRPQEAYDVAIDAYQLGLAAKNAQTENLSRTVLRAKQQLWAARETARLREMNETLKSIEALIEADLERSIAGLQTQLDQGEIGVVGFGEDRSALREDAERKVADLREAFRVASNGDVQERVSGLLFLLSLVVVFCFVDSLADSCRLYRIIWWMASPLRSCMTRSSRRLVPALAVLASSSMSRVPASIRSLVFP